MHKQYHTNKKDTKKPNKLKQNDKTYLRKPAQNSVGDSVCAGVGAADGANDGGNDRDNVGAVGAVVGADDGKFVDAYVQPSVNPD